MPICPKCGGELDEEGFCIECGYDVQERLDEEEDDWESEEPSESWED